MHTELLRCGRGLAAPSARLRWKALLPPRWVGRRPACSLRSLAV